MLELQLLTVPCFLCRFLLMLTVSPGNSIPRRISFPILSQGGAHPHSPVSLVKSPSVPGAGSACCQAVGRGGMWQAGSHLLTVTLFSAFSGDWQHHRQGKIWGPVCCQHLAPLDLTTHPIPLPAERRDREEDTRAGKGVLVGCQILLPVLPVPGSSHVPAPLNPS